jgi:large subunit ribosomal protein L15
VKLHDLKPAPGSRKAKRRVGRGIAAGQGKTAGRGTKGQKARAGGSIPAWFEGGQTPLHQRIPKLRGFKNLFKIHYEVVNLGDIARLVELGELESGEHPDSKPSRKGTPAPITVNQEILRVAGLVRRLDRPMKVLGGGGDLSTALFVVADAFSASARSKIEAAGGTVSVLEVPETKRPALRPETETSETPAPTAEPAEATADAEPAEATAETSDEAQADEASAPEASAAEPEASDAAAPKAARAKRAGKATESTDADTDADAGAAKPRAARKSRAAKPEPDA